MITLEQLDELEGRIVRALELIGDLRSENSRLESENERLRGEHDELKLALDEKEKTVQSLREQLDRTGKELNELKQKEAVLEKRITEMLSRLSDVEAARSGARPGGGSSYASSSSPAGSGVPAASFASSSPTPSGSGIGAAPVASLSGAPTAPLVAASASSPAPSSRLDDDLLRDADFAPSSVGGGRSDESIVFLEDEDLPLTPSRPASPAPTAAQTIPTPSVAEAAGEPAHGFARQVEYERDHTTARPHEDEDIIILDDEEDDVIFADEEEIEIIEQSPAAEPVPGPAGAAPHPAGSGSSEASVSLDDDILLDEDDDIGIFDMDDDDDFLIVEEEAHKK